jgi:uncharacterized membrane protein
MGKNRLEAFSDGVLAISITIMVLEMKVPHGEGLAVLRPLVPVFLSYVLSFIYVGIYWNNHHHLFHAVRQVNGGVLWANLHLLFWLSLIPFVTGWVGENRFSALPAAVYGVVMLMAGAAYYILTRVLIRCHERNSSLAVAVGDDCKGKVSMLLYSAAIPLSFWSRGIAFGLYAAVAALWLVPDRRIEKAVPVKD